MMRKTLLSTLMGVCIASSAAFTPRDATADMTGDWAVDINWVPLFIDSCFNLTVGPQVAPGVHSTDLAGSGGYLIDRGTVIIQVNPTGFPDLLYVGLNYESSDEAVGGWQQNLAVPNWGSHHMVRGTCPVAASSGSAAATGGQ
jgi:hypothetical protein